MERTISAAVNSAIARRESRPLLAIAEFLLRAEAEREREEREQRELVRP